MKKGAGGTSGGIAHFFLGLMMSFSGGFLLTNNIKVTSNFLGMRWHLFGNVGVSAFGATLFPFCIGVFYLFLDGGSKIGWLLTLGSVVAIIAGVLMNLQVYFQTTSLYVLGLMLVLLLGGLGLVFKSLKSYE